MANQSEGIQVRVETNNKFPRVGEDVTVEQFSCIFSDKKHFDFRHSLSVTHTIQSHHSSICCRMRLALVRHHHLIVWTPTRCGWDGRQVQYTHDTK
jgi:hypothetical protein